MRTLSGPLAAENEDQIEVTADRWFSGNWSSAYPDVSDGGES